jgi:hypothetical protein
VLLGLAVLALVIYCLVDCLQTEEDEVRHLPKVAWFLIILFFPVVGAVAWLVAGRPRRSLPPQRPVRPADAARPVAPDDDTSFLASLDASNAERRRLAEWERELQDRDERIREPSPVEESEPEGPDDPRTPA